MRTAQTKPRRSPLITAKKYWQLYLLALPALVLMVVYRYLPISGLYLAFTNFSAGMQVGAAKFVGLKWFKQLFQNPEFLRVLWNTVCISFLKLIFSFPVPIILSILLNEMRGIHAKKFFQTTLYLPHFLSWTVLAGIVFSMLSPQTGILRLFGVTQPLLLSQTAFRPILVITDIWKECGWGTIIYLSAISAISPEYYEAALMDGAGRFQRMRYITLPCISSTIVVLLLLKIGTILDAGFDQVFMLYNAAVYDVADILDTYIYRIGMAQGRFALATAGGLFKSVVGLILVFSANKLVKRIDPDSAIL